MEKHTSKTVESIKRQSTPVNVQVCDPKKQIVNIAAPINISKPASIIRIIPNTVTLPHNAPLKTFVVNCANNLQSKTSTSTSNATGDHEYVNKGDVETPLNIVYFNEPAEATEGTVHEILQEPIEFDQSKSNNLKRDLEDDLTKIPEKRIKVHSENCCDACRNTLETILQQQDEILKLLKNTASNLSKDMNLLPSMPFDDLNDFLDFDESLSNEKVLDQLITKLQRLLVSVDKRSVSNIMACLVTNELCKKISWIGIKDTIAFQNTNMVNHIIDIIQDHHGIDVDIIKSYIAEWLRRCSDRIASEIRKNKKRAQQFGYDDT